MIIQFDPFLVQKAQSKCGVILTRNFAFLQTAAAAAPGTALKKVSSMWQ